MDLFNGILTSALVVITGVYTYLTYRIVKSNQKAIQEQYRPYVVVFIESKNLNMLFWVKNIGSRPAHNISIKINPEIPVVKESRVDTINKMLNQKFMPPSFSVSNIIMGTPEYVDNSDYNRVYDIAVNYTDSSGKEYNEKYTIDLSRYIYGTKTSETSDSYKVTKKLSDIADAVNNLNSRTIL